jgi:hypothetical protein
MKPCRQCAKPFAPQRPLQAVCSPRCATRQVVAAGKAKKAAERAQTRARRESLKTIADRIREAQHAFNGYIRARDAGKPCICCGRPLEAGSVGGGYDAGHYRSTGSASHLRFTESNVHGQSKHCNRYGAGRAVDYRIGLIARIGLEAVEALEADNTPHKWRHAELIGIAATYKAKRKKLEVAA